MKLEILLEIIKFLLGLTCALIGSWLIGDVRIYFGVFFLILAKEALNVKVKP